MTKKSIIILAIMLGIGGAAIATRNIAARYLVRKSSQDIRACTRTGTIHKVLIANDRAEPMHTLANLCDKLVIINNDNQLRLVAFGEHDNHQTYDGITEKVLQKGQSLIVTLDQTGTYRFHDHLQDTVKGDFTVKN